MEQISVNDTKTKGDGNVRNNSLQYVEGLI